MELVTDSQQGTTYVAMTAREALDILAPQYEGDEFSLEEGFEVARERLEIEEFERNSQAIEGAGTHSGVEVERDAVDLD